MSCWQKSLHDGLISGPVQSLYLKMLDLNRCNHRFVFPWLWISVRWKSTISVDVDACKSGTGALYRTMSVRDFQNVGVNGARSGAMAGKNATEHGIPNIFQQFEVLNLNSYLPRKNDCGSQMFGKWRLFEGSKAWPSPLYCAWVTDQEKSWFYPLIRKIAFHERVSAVSGDSEVIQCSENFAV